MNIDPKREANAEISRLIKEAQKCIDRCEAIADEYGLDFKLNLGGYGMGGSYSSEQSYRRDYGIPEEQEVPEFNDYGEPTYGWVSSSSNC